MEVSDFAEIEEEFERRVRRIVWAAVATVDRKGRPRSRILHPVWEGTTGWIATGRQSFKAKHLAQTPYVSLSYWDPQHEMVFAECSAEWADDQVAKDHAWELIKSQPEPYGYDPAMFWPGGPADPMFGALKLTPWRIELYSIRDLVQGAAGKVWRPAGR